MISGIIIHSLCKLAGLTSKQISDDCTFKNVYIEFAVLMFVDAVWFYLLFKI